MLNSKSQIVVNSRDVAFYDTDVRLANLNKVLNNLEIRARDFKKQLRLAKRGNPNKVYVGKRVMVVGKQTLKGYKGVILDVSLDGMASLALDGRGKSYQKPMALDNLRLLS